MGATSTVVGNRLSSRGVVVLCIDNTTTQTTPQLDIRSPTTGLVAPMTAMYNFHYYNDDHCYYLLQTALQHSEFKVVSPSPGSIKGNPVLFKICLFCNRRGVVCNYVNLSNSISMCSELNFFPFNNFLVCNLKKHSSIT